MGYTIKRSLVIALFSGTLHMPIQANTKINLPQIISTNLKQTALPRERKAIQKFYGAQEQSHLWVDNGQWTPAAQVVINTLGTAHKDGLNPSHYHGHKLVMLDLNNETDAIKGELMLSAALLHYASDISHGQDKLRKADAYRALRKGKPQVSNFLTQAATHAQNPTAMKQWLINLAPQTPYYQNLKKSLAHYQDLINRQVPWPALTKKLKMGVQDPAVTALKKRLHYLNDMPNDASNYFDSALESVIKHFQWRRGLKQDGDVGPATRKALSKPLNDIITQISLNMERARWVPDPINGRYVEVNIGGQKLRCMNGPRKVYGMKVIVGKKYRRTPVFSAPMTALTFHPTWIPTRNIIRKDILPKLRKDPSYLDRKGMSVYSGWGAERVRLNPYNINWYGNGVNFKFVQRSGSKNALGKVKFFIKNPYSIYLHDTSQPKLFNKPIRLFSSGCIRLSKPQEMAYFALSTHPNWSRSKINEKLGGSKTQRVSLNEPLSVHMVYRTAWVDDKNNLHLRPDVYKRDSRVAKAML
jgi:murein L,D-transpeptidase YcbB/YkuD